MESTPKKRPIIMLSTSMHSITVMAESIWVTSICRNIFRIIFVPCLQSLPV